VDSCFPVDLTVCSGYLPLELTQQGGEVGGRWRVGAACSWSTRSRAMGREGGQVVALLPGGLPPAQAQKLQGHPPPPTPTPAPKETRPASAAAMLGVGSATTSASLHWPCCHP